MNNLAIDLKNNQLSRDNKSMKIYTTSIVLFLFILSIIGNSLGAYNIGSIPIQWISSVIVVCIIIFVSIFSKLIVVPGGKLFFLFLTWTFIITGINIMVIDYSKFIPTITTLPYLPFVCLRFFSLLSFIATVYLIYFLIARGYKQQIIKWIVIIGLVVSIIAIYIYFAQILGWPEPFRSRIGTGGGLQSTRFTSDFHRAMGTFREPSHLAEWLITPFMLSVIYYRRVINKASILMCSVILFTGSLTGILGFSIGFFLTVIIIHPPKNQIKKIIGLVLVFAISLLLFNQIGFSNNGDKIQLIQSIGHRIQPILEGGMLKSNRGYIFEYVKNSSMPWMGFGLGNANLVLTEYLHNTTIVSFLSLYFNLTFSTGILGLVLVVCFLLWPIAKIATNKRLCNNPKLIWLLTAYITWLIMFSIHSEEFSMMFAVIYAFLVHEIGFIKAE